MRYPLSGCQIIKNIEVEEKTFFVESNLVSKSSVSNGFYIFPKNLKQILKKLKASSKRFSVASIQDF